MNKQEQLQKLLKQKLLERQQANLERFKASGMTRQQWHKAEKKRHQAKRKRHNAIELKAKRITKRAKAFELDFISP